MAAASPSLLLLLIVTALLGVPSKCSDSGLLHLSEKVHEKLHAHGGVTGGVGTDGVATRTCIEKHADEVENACYDQTEHSRQAAALALTFCRLRNSGSARVDAVCGSNDRVNKCIANLRGEEHTLFAIAQMQLDLACEDMQRRKEEERTQQVLHKMASLGPELIEIQQKARDELTQGQNELLDGQATLKAHAGSVQTALEALRSGQDELSQSLSEARSTQELVRQLQEQQYNAMKAALDEHAHSAQRVSDKLRGAISAADRVESSIDAASSALRRAHWYMLRLLGPFACVNDALAHVAAWATGFFMTLPTCMRKARCVAVLKLALASTLEWLGLPMNNISFLVGYRTATLVLRALLWSSASVDVLSQAITHALPQCLSSMSSRDSSMSASMQPRAARQISAVHPPSKQRLRVNVGVQVSPRPASEEASNNTIVNDDERGAQTKTNSPQST